MAFNQPRIGLTTDEIFLLQHACQKSGIGFDGPNSCFADHLKQGLPCFFAAVPTCDEFGDHWIVIGANFPAFFHARIDAPAIACLEQVQSACAGEEATHRVFRVKPGFHCPALGCDFMLG